MQLKKFTIKGLFNRIDHEISLHPPKSSGQIDMLEDIARPSVVLLLGDNGVGKTTVLRMMKGILQLDFQIFRKVPFNYAELLFNNNELISVKRAKDKDGRHLKVEFNDLKVRLDPRESGPLKKKDSDQVDDFRNNFLAATRSINFSLIETNRFLERVLDREGSSTIQAIRRRTLEYERQMLAFTSRSHLNKQDSIPEGWIASRVKGFVSEAQVDYRNYFSSSEPNLFAKIVNRLGKPEEFEVQPSELLSRLEKVKTNDAINQRLGLVPDQWDFDQLAVLLTEPSTSPEGLTVLSAYVDVLESRDLERKLVADRLITFEDLISDFYSGIDVQVHPNDGLKIITKNDEILSEEQLSSGQYNLLYLMVSALVTKRRGTVIAIDEPELSMHISWQRRLVKALVKCSTGAEPQFIFATHSPDIAADYQESIIYMGETAKK